MRSKKRAAGNKRSSKRKRAMQEEEEEGRGEAAGNQRSGKRKRTRQAVEEERKAAEEEEVSSAVSSPLRDLDFPDELFDTDDEATWNTIKKAEADIDAKLGLLLMPSRFLSPNYLILTNEVLMF